MSHPGQRILDIPNEHLAEIFRLAIGDPRYRGKTRTIIQLVCRNWSRVMLNSKFLWSKITVEVEDLSQRMNPCYGELGPPQPGDLDLAYIAQCLRVAHGHPLDITLRIANMPEDRFRKRWNIINEALELLRSHSIRLRSLSCSAPIWFFDRTNIEFKTLFDPDYLPRLETLSLFVEPDESILTPSSPLISVDVVDLSQSLLDLSLNFPFPHFDVAWSSITSFAGGFDDHGHFFNVLPCMVALDFLHLRYIQPLGAVVPERCITLDSLRHLKLSSCAVAAMSLMVDKLRLPGVKELSLSSEFHLHHFTEACPVEGLSADVAASLCAMFERSGATIGTLNISVDSSIEDAKFLQQLFAKLSFTVRSLQLEFEWSLPSRRRDIVGILGKLTAAVRNASVLLPRMTELEVIGRNQNYIFEGPALEGLIESRWDDEKRSSSCIRLQKLRLRRVRYVDDFRPPGSDSLAGSSLALTLWKFRSAGLNVQWIDEYLYEPHLDTVPGDVDVLDDTQKYIPTMQRG
ncbi:hypothetical protein BDZ89DRAFT_1057281 [Hymenopellis radicata]|nr:hypothetical protein BDZ89DRAFT_1057281 [Hymenopellis radicata]